MVFKRNFGDEGRNKSPQSYYSQTTPKKFQKVVKYSMDEECVQEMVEKIVVRLVPTLRKIVKEELEHGVTRFHSSTRHSLVHQTETFPTRELQLQLTRKLPSPLFTNSKIEDKEHNTLQVQLVDANSNTIIHHGKLSSIKVEIVVLNGDFVADGRENWTDSEFNENIVHQRVGKRPLLIGDLTVTLVNGVGSLGNVSFTDNSSWMRSSKFKLGVRAVPGGSTSGVDIKEAVSEAFRVLDHRGESYQKHCKPFLDDPVWRLTGISKTGTSRKKLESQGINTVKDFLKYYNIDASYLREVLGKSAVKKAWDTMVRHANECHLDNTCYRFYGGSEGIELLFNCVYKLIAVSFTGHDYQSLNVLDSRQKALVEKLRHIALQNVQALVPIHSSLIIPPIEQLTVGHNISFSGSQLDLQHNSFSIIDQDKPEQHLDFNLRDTASYPCNDAAEEDYLPEDDSASQTDPPMLLHGFSQPTFVTGNSSSVPSEGGYDKFDNWHFNTQGTTYAQNNVTTFGELSSQMYHPLGTTWGNGNDNDIFTTSTLTAHCGIPYQMTDFGFNFSRSGSGSPKAGWLKIRAAVMWKIVWRIAAARRNAMYSFS